jgi:hypothetical protein
VERIDELALPKVSATLLAVRGPIS